MRELKKYLIPYLEEVTEKKGKKYICPFCNSGANGNHNTPAFSIIPNTNEEQFKCHACSKSGDIFDIDVYLNGGTVAESKKRLSEKFRNTTYTPSKATKKEIKEPVNYTDFFFKAHQNLDKCEYLTKRGISKELQNKFNIGYVENWQHSNPQYSSPMVIIPTSDYSYYARDVRENIPESSITYAKQKRGSVHLFNPDALYLEEKYCFVVEGEIDCLSVLECGYNCIALGSANQIEKLLLSACKIKKPNGTLIFALDNDYWGSEWSKKITEFKKIGIPCITADISGDCKDPNELLMKNREELKNNLINAVKSAEEYVRQEAEYSTPEWLMYNKSGEPYINEPEFIKSFISERALKCINAQFFSIDGVVSEGEIKHTLQEKVSQYIIKNIAKITDNLYKGLLNYCYSEPLKVNINEIHIKNGLLKTNGEFISEKRFCINRLNVNYDENAECPCKWLEFLGELLEYDEIKTLQEYIGYCFIPTTKAQVMLFLIGNGGEGKSVIGEVLSAIFKNSMVQSEIHKIGTDKYIGADLENKLLMLDDDINFSAMQDTGKLKSIVTASTPFRIERKHANKYDSYLYTRILCFGNNCLSSLYDNTDGFYRRQIIIKTKPKRADRTDNTSLASEIINTELDGVFLWAFDGLKRLINNGFAFTVSEKSKQALKEAQEENFNFNLFIKDSVFFDEKYEVTSADLYDSYSSWCIDNGFTPFKRDTVMRHLKSNAEKLNIKYSENCLSYNNKRARGFKGMKPRIKTVSTVC